MCSCLICKSLKIQQKYLDDKLVNLVYDYKVCYKISLFTQILSLESYERSKMIFLLSLYCNVWWYIPVHDTILLRCTVCTLSNRGTYCTWYAVRHYLHDTQWTKMYSVQCTYSQTVVHAVHDTHWTKRYSVHTLKQWYILYMTHSEPRCTVYTLTNSGTYSTWHTVN